ncbi:MAG: glycosyltransferase family 2 protein [Vicinamibacterales bacterium]
MPFVTALNPPAPPRLSIVSTLYNSERSLEQFCARASAAARDFAEDYEIVLVDDGSPDASIEIAIALSQADPHIRVVELSRNYGHHKAMMTGLSHARGDLVFLVDSDLEEDPAWLPAFFGKMKSEGADVVYGVQNRRKGSLGERVGGALFYATLNWMLEFPIPRNVITARLMTARYVSQLIRHRDREVCLAALWVMTGFRQVPIIVEKQDHGGTTYGIGQRLSVLVNAVTSFSNRPLVLIFYLGTIIMLTAAVAGVILVWRVLVHGAGVAGWPSLVVSVWFLGGVTIFCLGVIGMYLSKVFMETKDRPYTVVRAYYPDRGRREDD